MHGQRRVVGELMDRPDADPAELAEALGWLRRFNARLGGIALSLHALQRLMKGRQNDGAALRILDVGTGSADFPLAVAQWASRSGLRVEITAVDNHDGTLAVARDQIGNRQGIELVKADARLLAERYADQHFHYAHAGLFLHHLPDIEVLTVLRIMDRLSSRGLIWNDLVRSRLNLLAARILTLRAPRIVKHDAAASVEAGFTMTEVRDVARRLELQRVSVHRSLLKGRFVLTSAKPGC